MTNFSFYCTVSLLCCCHSNCLLASFPCCDVSAAINHCASARSDYSCTVSYFHFVQNGSAAKFLLRIMRLHHNLGLLNNAFISEKKLINADASHAHLVSDQQLTSIQMIRVSSIASSPHLVFVSSVGGIGMHPVFSFPFIIQPLCPFCLFSSHFVCLSFSLASVFARVGWTMLMFLLLVSPHQHTSTLSFPFASLLPECALQHSEPFLM